LYPITVKQWLSLELIFNTINRRLKKLFVNKLIHNQATVSSNENVTTIPYHDKKFIVFPYIKPISEMISSVIDKSEYIIGFRCLNKLNSFVKTHEDKDQTLSNNNVIYKISCKNCNASYVSFEIERA